MEVIKYLNKKGYRTIPQKNKFMNDFLEKQGITSKNNKLHILKNIDKASIKKQREYIDIMENEFNNLQVAGSKKDVISYKQEEVNNSKLKRIFNNDGFEGLKSKLEEQNEYKILDDRTKYNKYRIYQKFITEFKNGIELRKKERFEKQILLLNAYLNILNELGINEDNEESIKYIKDEMNKYNNVSNIIDKIKINDLYNNEENGIRKLKDLFNEYKDNPQIDTDDEDENASNEKSVSPISTIIILTLFVLALIQLILLLNKPQNKRRRKDIDIEDKIY
tara:strand:- start:1470 stop:2303 length:834 start_codon:yes stop_codon:yes gene_type:complete